jgi:hypothetical protein
MKIPATPFFVACCLSACGGQDSPSQVQAPGGKERADTAVLEAGAAALQDRPPVEALNAYLDGFHFYNGAPEGQMEAHHYCAILNEDLIQCVIYDGNVRDAKLMGVEYILSEKLFRTLPAAERKFWHSHVHEVKSGQLVAPGIPQLAEHRLMEKLVHTYGKTWHTWHTDRDAALPTGVPQLMMGFTADGQADAGMVAERDRRMRLSSEKNRRDRGDIQAPQIVEGADHWQREAPLQLQDPTGQTHAHGER